MASSVLNLAEEAIFFGKLAYAFRDLIPVTIPARSFATLCVVILAFRIGCAL